MLRNLIRNFKNPPTFKRNHRISRRPQQSQLIHHIEHSQPEHPSIHYRFATKEGSSQQFGDSLKNNPQMHHLN